jgi:hypothetical protein
MPAKKGTRIKNPGRRKKGVPNRVTREVRAVIQEFVEHNSEGAQALYEKAARRNPAKALDIFVKMAEFVLPKLNRTEVRAVLPQITLPSDCTAEDAAQAYMLMTQGTIDVVWPEPRSMPVEHQPQPPPVETAPIERPTDVPDNDPKVVDLTIWEKLAK